MSKEMSSVKAQGAMLNYFSRENKMIFACIADMQRISECSQNFLSV